MGNGFLHPHGMVFSPSPGTPGEGWGEGLHSLLCDSGASPPSPKPSPGVPGEGLKRALLILAWLVIYLSPSLTLAHDVPTQLPEPQSIPESWNVIESSASNIDRLLDENLLRDITFQIANTDASLRYLIAHGPKDEHSCRELLQEGSDIIATIRDKSSSAGKVAAQWKEYRARLGTLESAYPADIVKSAVYICPMHPLDRHLNPDEKCSVCGMPLIRRHLPASGVYEKPGEPTMKLAVICAPLVVGQRADVKIRLSRNDGSAVLLNDLLEMHTRKIHLLINDQSLGDYHHEHPEPTDVPGEYAFSFTPAKAGPYRIWADVVPAASSIQEYVVGDIPAQTKPDAIAKQKRNYSAMVNGRQYVLSLGTGDDPIRAGQTVIGTISVSDSAGKPVVTLEPVMGAFAHIVGFNEDLKTVLHIHPYGKEPMTPTDRAGPAFAFKFYAPAPGFYRLYGQVQIDGKSEFAPFDVTILPADAPATRKGIQ